MMVQLTVLQPSIRILLFIVVINHIQTAEIGDYCSTQNGEAGKCELLSNCPAAIVALQQQQIFPKTCGYVGSVPIVCCSQGWPASTTSTTTTTTTTTTSTTPRPTKPTVTGTTANYGPTGRISRTKCKEYAKYVFKSGAPPINLPGANPVTTDECGFKVVELIVGGVPAIPKEFPHMALIGYDINGEKSWSCGGSLISEAYVLTAGHCLHSINTGYAKFIRLGDYDYAAPSSDVQEREVLNRIKHPEYIPLHKYHDIGLLQMSPVKLTPFVRPACLHTLYELQAKRAIATGWGRVDYNQAGTTTLQKVTLDVFSHDSCNRSYKNYINSRLKNGIVDETQVCAGSSDERKDTCQGDSGGPLQIYNKLNIYCMYEIVGITSFGKSCGILDSPGIYTRVSHYIDWIESVVWPQ